MTFNIIIKSSPGLMTFNNKNGFPLYIGLNLLINGKLFCFPPPVSRAQPPQAQRAVAALQACLRHAQHPANDQLGR